GTDCYPRSLRAGDLCVVVCGVGADACIGPGTFRRRESPRADLEFVLTKSAFFHRYPISNFLHRAQLHRKSPGGMRREGNTMSEIIRCEHLRYVYNPGLPDETAALDDVSFSIEEGDFVGIIGSTGSGKSTLISHFNGLNRPTSGRILIDGKDMWAEGADLRSFRFLVGLVFQYPESQLFEETCAKDIAYGPRNMGLDEAEIARRVEEAAAFTGLDKALLDRSPFELSGGQKRRVAIAGVMAMEPR